MKPPGLPDFPKLGSGGGGGCAAGIGDLRIEGANDQPSVKHGPPGSGGDRLRPAPTAVRSWSPSPGRRPTSDSFNGSWRLPTTSGQI